MYAVIDRFYNREMALFILLFRILYVLVNLIKIENLLCHCNTHIVEFLFYCEAFYVQIRDGSSNFQGYLQT